MADKSVVKYRVVAFPRKFCYVKRGLYYSPKCGRLRWYRQTLSSPDKGLKLLLYNTKKRAQEVCDSINSAMNENFLVEKIKVKV